MKYFKFAQISAETGISWAIEQPLSGPSYPSLPGLTNIIQLDYNRLYYLGEVDDIAEEDPDNHIWELTLEEYANELNTHIQLNINKKLDRIYDEEKDFRKAILGKYDNTASIAGIYKYEQAKAYLADGTAAPDIEVEANLRGVNVATMSQRIITNHEAFRLKEAKIAGIRGLVYDRLNSFEFNMSDPKASYEEFISQEKIGTRIEMQFDPETGGDVETEVDVVVGKYELAISTRYAHLG